jgi:hypothetical protein
LMSYLNKRCLYYCCRLDTYSTMTQLSDWHAAKRKEQEL